MIKAKSQSAIGFTLLELLIVIIIIGLLAAVGMVQYAKSVANAKNSQAKAVLSEMRKAAQAYYSLNNAWPATCVSISVDLDGDGNSDVTFAAPASPDFTFSCPSGVGTATKSGTGGPNVYTWTINFDSGIISSS